MKYVIVICALSAFGTGMLAAWYWYRASKVMIVPMWERNGVLEPVDPRHGTYQWVTGIIETAKKSGPLNATAARLTAVSVFFSGFTSLLGAFSN